jgi:hypothetical protein
MSKNETKRRPNWNKEWYAQNNGWSIEKHEITKDNSIYSKVHSKEITTFVTSYMLGQKLQIVDLESEEYNIDEVLFKSLKPNIEISDDIKIRHDCGGIYYLYVSLIDKNFELIDSFTYNETMPAMPNPEWKCIQHIFEFDPIKPSVRYIIFIHAGQVRIFSRIKE